MPDVAGTRLARRVGELRKGGTSARAELPTRKDLTARPEADRRALLDELRVELYAVSAILADAVVRRADRDRGSYPPYGLARSRFSEWRMVIANPPPYEEGSIDSFFTLWKAFVDTAVLQLQRELHELRHHGDQIWLMEHLDELLALFRTAGDKQVRARMKDAMTFIYGGLQFGVSVCVQLAEVMARRLVDVPGTTPDDVAADIARSSGPAYRLAAMNLEHALVAYRELLARPGEPGREGDSTPGWMIPERFAVQETASGPRQVTFDEHETTAEGPTAYTTLGCPARIASERGQTPILTLWRWCADVAHDAGLLDTGGAFAQGTEPGTTNT